MRFRASTHENHSLQWVSLYGSSLQWVSLYGSVPRGHVQHSGVGFIREQCQHAFSSFCQAVGKYLVRCIKKSSVEQIGISARADRRHAGTGHKLVTPSTPYGIGTARQVRVNRYYSATYYPICTAGQLNLMPSRQISSRLNVLVQFGHVTSYGILSHTPQIVDSIARA